MAYRPSMVVFVGRAARMAVWTHGRRYRSSVAAVDKVWTSAADAVSDVRHGSTVLSGGFGLCGTPDTLLQALAKAPEARALCAVSNNPGFGDRGLAPAIRDGRVARLVCTFIGANKDVEHRILNGELEIELNPQGTLVERLRAAGAGIPAFYTSTGVGTAVEKGGLPTRYNSDWTVAETSAPGETRVFGGRTYLLREALHGDVAFIRAWKADRSGNCMFRYSAQNYAPAMARAAALTIVEADEIVETGELDTNTIHLPGVYVDRIIQSTVPMAVEEGILARDQKSGGPTTARDRIAIMAAAELTDGMTVNLGVGLPMRVPPYATANVIFESENGILGLGPPPATEADVDPTIVNAGKEAATLVRGAATFDTVESFSMIRGGHLDVAMLGALQVGANGDLANYVVPGKTVKGMGGAMDLVSNPDKTRVVITMEHTDRDGNPKLVDTCTLPLTGARVVSRVITDLGAFSLDRAGAVTLTALQPGVTVAEVRAKTGARFDVADDVVESAA